MTFEAAINSAPVVLVEFYASWCPHCQRMMPVMDQVKELADGEVPVFQLDIDENQEAANSAGVKSIPSFLIYNNGVEAWRHTGEIDGNDLLAKVQSYK